MRNRGTPGFRPVACPGPRKPGGARCRLTATSPGNPGRCSRLERDIWALPPLLVLLILSLYFRHFLEAHHPDGPDFRHRFGGSRARPGRRRLRHPGRYMNGTIHGPSVRFDGGKGPKAETGPAILPRTVQAALYSDSAIADLRRSKSTGFTTNPDEPLSRAADIRPESP